MATVPPIKFDLRGALRPIRMLGIAGEAIQEVERAHEKHGSNADLADGVGSGGTLIRDMRNEGGLEIEAGFGANIYLPSNYELEEAMQNVNDDRCADGRKHTRAGILLEEVFEALATDDPAELRKELIQVIAMGLDWVADLDARS